MQKTFKRAISTDEITQKDGITRKFVKKSVNWERYNVYKMALSADSKFVPALTNIGLVFAENQQFEFAENALLLL